MEKEIRRPRLEKNIGKNKKQDKLALGIIAAIGLVIILVAGYYIIKDLRAKKFPAKSYTQIEQIEEGIRNLSASQVNEEVEKRVQEVEKNEETKPKNEKEKEEVYEKTKLVVEEELQMSKEDWNPTVKTNIEKAIDIVKKEVKNDKYAYDVIDILLDKRVVVVVKNPDSTEVYEYYIVNVENGQFEVKQ